MPPVQAFSQRPQLLLSIRFVHTHDPMPNPGHLKSPGGQAQAALVQMAFELQYTMQDSPQFPQLWTSDAVSMQVPLTGSLGHSMTVGGEALQVHLDAVQVPRPQE